MNKHEGRFSFAHIFKWEQQVLLASRAKVPFTDTPQSLGESSIPEATAAGPIPKIADLNKDAAVSNLAGLAMSGGGIRSATFNLGVLQAMADLGILRHFDYMSTVSGGGYIGGWLSKWIHARGGSIEKVEEELCTATDGEDRPRSEPGPVLFLRRYSNFLTPRTGLFSADTWTLISTYIRNTTLNMAMLVAWMCLLFLIPRGVLWLVDRQLKLADQFLPATIIFLVTVCSMALNISLKGKALRGMLAAQSQAWVLMTVCLPLLLAGFFGSIAVLQNREALTSFSENLGVASNSNDWWLLVPGGIYFAVWSIGWGIAQKLNSDANKPYAKQRSEMPSIHYRISEAMGHLLCALGSLAVGSFLLVILCSKWRVPLADINAIELTTFGMPFMLTLFGITLTLMIGLIGRLYSDGSREWWARQGAWTIILSVTWLTIFGCTFYLPAILAWAFNNYFISSTFATAATTLITYLGLKSGSSKKTGATEGRGKFELVALIAPYAFSILLIGLMTTATQAILSSLPDVPYPKTVKNFDNLPYFISAYLDHSLHIGINNVCTVFTICLAAALILGWRLDINKFSLYMMYRLRLVRAYFGASNFSRAPHPFTGFDGDDDPKLHDLLEQKGPNGANGIVQRPYHICNAAINLVNGKELAWQNRKAANFCFTPGYCGFELPLGSAAERGAYRSTKLYASQSALGDDSDNVVKLGTAVAVSGAAANPNMGYHSSPPLNFLMTLFNLRLGRWSPNPVKDGTWKRSSPRIGLFSILAELFGLTDTEASFLNLSDGGHFENLGLYELVRRRCQLIIVVDASCDDKYHFDDLGNAIRKCLTDFNIPITLDVRSIQNDDKAALQRSCCVTGRISYHQADGGSQEGVLLYLKPAVIGGENADLFNYYRLHPEFPHQTTADQWFDESQFDSYRSLGKHIALGGLKNAVSSAKSAGAMADTKKFVQHMCASLNPLPPSQQ